MKNLYEVKHKGALMGQEVMEFVKKWHYSKSCRSLMQKHVFILVDKKDNLIGVAIYGRPIGRNSNQLAVELRRFCLIDDTPKNTESFFLASTLRFLKKNTAVKEIITFADPNKGHKGIIYKATNFKFDGLEKSSNPRVIKYKKKTFHQRQFYQKKQGIYTPDAIKLQQLVKSGEAKIVKQKKKLRYVYEF